MFNKIETLTTMCPECEVEKKVQYGINEETINVRKEKINVKAKVFYCPEGNHFFADLEDEEEKTQYVYREYRKRKNLLQPEEVKQIRSKYGLSQEAFSTFLGFGKKTIHRYETGAIPDDPHNSFMKLIKDTDNFQRHFDNVKDNIPDKLKQKIEKRLLELQTDGVSLPSVYIGKLDIFEANVLPEPVFIQGISASISPASHPAVSVSLCNAEVETGYEKYSDISWVSTNLEKKNTPDKELARAA